VKGPKWIKSEEYEDFWTSIYGEAVDYHRMVTIQEGWYYWPAGALHPKGPFKTRQLAQKCGDRPKPKRRK
jgi:hypothetical protein